jgi:serine/threonine protein kinase
MSICDSLPQKISEYPRLSRYLGLALGLLYTESRPMTGAPLSELKTEANAYRARRLSSSDFGEGDVLAGKYRIEAVLGEGGMGIVLSATHIELGSRVAIKVLRPELAHTEDAVLRLLVEARSAASIRSEHVARVLDVGRLESGLPFLVLEHLEGRDLQQILAKSGRLASQVAVDFVLQACKALSEAHSAGIVHRDLKPENLFLSYRADGTPVVKVLDFGISKRLTHDGRVGARTNPSELLGSPLYMAPEQMKGSADIDARADIWSLGVVLYELCTGQSPFFGETIPAICARVIGVDPTPPRALLPEMPAGLEAVILRCLQRNADARPADIAELAADLAAFGSSDATAYAASAQLVMAGARTNPKLEAPFHVERVPTALSATLAVLGQGLRAPRPRRFQPRVALVGLALASATVLGGAFTFRSVQAREASLLSTIAAAPTATADVARPDALAIAAPSVLADTASSSRTPSIARATVPVTRTQVSEAANHGAPLKHAARTGHNPWDPKSFGGRL